MSYTVGNIVRDMVILVLLGVCMHLWTTLEELNHNVREASLCHTTQHAAK